MNYIKLFLLGLLSERLDDIIAMFEKVDARLDRYLEQERGNQATLQIDIAKLEEKLANSVASTERAERTQTRIRTLTQ